MNIEPKISVVIPVYNVRNQIEKCAESLFGQSYNNIEFLFIDDCSPDDSIEILKTSLNKYPERISQTRIIRMEKNSGQASVRNRGLTEASGEYFIYCDSDDWIDLDLYQTMIESAVTTNADVVICDITHEYSDRQELEIMNFNVLTGKELMKNLYKSNHKLYVWNKLVRIEILRSNNILFWEGLNMWEDVGYSCRLFYFADKIVSINGPTYHYNRKNECSISNTIDLTHSFQMIENVKHIEKFYKAQKDNVEFTRSLDYLKLLSKSTLLGDSFKSYKTYKKLFPGCERIIKDLNLKNFPLKMRLRFKMARFRILPLFILQKKIRKFL